MACFTPEDNAYSLPNVNAFLDTPKYLTLIEGISEVFLIPRKYARSKRKEHAMNAAIYDN